MEILYKDDFARQDIWLGMVKSHLMRVQDKEPTTEEVLDVEEIHIEVRASA
jgi:hypothetical protein